MLDTKNARSIRSVINPFLERSFRRYLLIGSCAFAVDYLVLIALYYGLDVPLVVATSAGFLSGLLVSFTVNRLWVFGQTGRQRNTLRQSVEYSSLLVFNYFFTVLVVSGLNRIGIEPSYGKFLVIACIVVWNYLIFKKVIFAKTRESLE